MGSGVLVANSTNLEGVGPVCHGWPTLWRVDGGLLGEERATLRRCDPPRRWRLYEGLPSRIDSVRPRVASPDGRR